MKATESTWSWISTSISKLIVKVIICTKSWIYLHQKFNTHHSKILSSQIFLLYDFVLNDFVKSIRHTNLIRGQERVKIWKIMIIDNQYQVYNVIDWIFCNNLQKQIIYRISMIHLSEKKAKWIIQSVSDRRLYLRIQLTSRERLDEYYVMSNDRYHDCILLDLLCHICLR